MQRIPVEALRPVSCGESSRRSVFSLTKHLLLIDTSESPCFSVGHYKSTSQILPCSSILAFTAI